MSSDLELARTIRRWISGDPVTSRDEVLTASAMTGHRALADEVMRRLPEARRRFGEPVIRAAARRLPAGSCRFCAARADASVHDSMQPRFDEATRLILGMPCRRCMRAHVDAGRRGETGPTARRGGSGPSVMSSPGSRPAAPYRHPVSRPCAVCTAEQAALRQAAARGLTASAAAAADPKIATVLAAAARPHAPKLAPTGWIAEVVHDGMSGAALNCSCIDCKAHRRERYLHWDRSRRR